MRHIALTVRIIPHSNWPFVTLDDYAPKGRNVLQLSEALMVRMCPVVTKDKLEAWDQYVQEHRQLEWM